MNLTKLRNREKRQTNEFDKSVRKNTHMNKPFNVVVSEAKNPELLTKDEILEVDGIYAAYDAPTIRFVISQGSTFLFGDGCPLYVSSDFDKGGGHKRYFKVDETIIFQKTPKI